MLSPKAERLPEIVVRTKASDDIVHTYQFSVEAFGLAVAEEYLNGLDAAITTLGEFPELGPIRYGIAPPIRVLAYRSHRIFYNFDGSTVFIIRIFHHAVNAAARLNED